jgi:hypothetical protein
MLRPVKCTGPTAPRVAATSSCFGPIQKSLRMPRPTTSSLRRSSSGWHGRSDPRARHSRPARPSSTCYDSALLLGTGRRCEPDLASGPEPRPCLIALLQCFCDPRRLTRAIICELSIARTRSRPAPLKKRSGCAEAADEADWNNDKLSTGALLPRFLGLACFEIDLSKLRLRRQRRRRKSRMVRASSRR